MPACHALCCTPGARFLSTVRVANQCQIDGQSFEFVWKMQ
jgi:hypothetical protein